MHLYLITRGIKQDVDRFISELSAKYLPFKFFKPNGKGGFSNETQECAVQVGVRPVQFWEIAYPEPFRDQMLNTIFSGQVKPTQHKRHNKFLWWIRKILGIKKLGEWNKTAPVIPLFRGAVEFVQVGEKKDRYQDGIEML